MHVIFLSETDATQRDWLVYKDEIAFSYSVLPSRRWRMRGYHCLLNWGMRAALRRQAPDVVVCGGYSYLASWTAQAWARRRQVRFLAWVESTLKDKRRGHLVVERLKRRFMDGCNGFVVPGRASAEYVKSYGRQDSEIFVAPNAVDNERFSRGAQAARDRAGSRNLLGVPQRFFLFVGRLVKAKGVFDLLEAYGQLAPELRAEWGLVFAGDGPARKQLEKRAARIGGEVVFAGFVQRDQLASYYGLADVLVFPTYSDTWGLVVNEALACGLPVIAARAAGCADDLVQDGCSGYLLDAGNVAQLRAAMEKLAQEPELRREMGRRGREIIANYSPEACAEGLALAAEGA